MKYKNISEEKWRSVCSAQEVVGDVRGRAVRLVACLKDVLDNPSVKESCGVEISVIEDGPTIATIESPLGAARLTLDWTVVAEELAGELRLERPTVNSCGADEWQGVWGVYVPRFEDPWAGSHSDKLVIPMRSMFGRERDNALFALGMSMLYAIAAGPQLQS